MKLPKIFKNPVNLLFFLYILVLLGVSAISTVGIPMNTLYPIQDASVYEREPDTNFGDGESITIRNYYLNRNQECYLQFNTTSYSQKLGIRIPYYVNDYDTYSLGIYIVTGEWDEMTITWNNRPIEMELLATIKFRISPLSHGALLKPLPYYVEDTPLLTLCIKIIDGGS